MMVVLFDVDRTLVSVNCTAALVRALAADGLAPRGAAASVAIHHALYMLRLRSFPALMSAAYALLEGCEIAKVEACAERIVRDVAAPSIYREALASIAMHRAKGDRIVLASAAPAVVIERVARCVDVPDAIATDFERLGPRFGGVKPPPAYRDGKVELARRAGLFDDGDPHVYTDHVEDIALVRASRFATLVNPAPAFVEQVRRSGVAHEVVHWQHVQGRAGGATNGEVRSLRGL